MAESVAVAVGIGDQRLTLHCGSKSGLQLVLRKMCNNLQPPMIDTAPRRGRYPEHFLGRLGQVVQPASQISRRLEDIPSCAGSPAARSSST